MCCHFSDWTDSGAGAGQDAPGDVGALDPPRPLVAEFLRQRIGEVPQAAIVLGSGLGDFADQLGDPTVIRYEDIPHWPASRVTGHAGKLVVGTTRGRRVACNVCDKIT